MIDRHRITHYFSKTDWCIWVGSLLAITLSFFLFDNKNYIVFIASLVGVTSLIFNAKGNPFGQILMVLFSLLYGIISYSFAYYGEMITYLAMTMPMAVFAFIAWIRNPFKGRKSEVTVNRIEKKEYVFMWLLTAAVTFIFYFILKYFNTTNLIPSTLSVTTSFIAVYLTFRRSPYYAIGYALNDVVLIVLWILASIEDARYISVVVCFVTFFVNDLYGFISWRRLEKRQELESLS